ncbi:MAG: TIGR00296 family protein [Candidatus Micrarchaeaceae archaeon]
MHFYSLEQGRELVSAARVAIELYIRNPRFDRKLIENRLENFNDRHGIFVTLESYPSSTLRGCVGYIEGIKEVKHLIIEAAIAAAFEDPRFPELSLDELNKTVVEVSILSEPKKMPSSAEERLKELEIGRDGLIIQYGSYSGLLLPNVATEEHFTKEEFLEAVCDKAGIPSSYWRQQNVNLYRFETQIFKEKMPSGDVYLAGSQKC